MKTVIDPSAVIVMNAWAIVTQADGGEGTGRH